MELDRNTTNRLGYSTSKGMDNLRREAGMKDANLRKAVYHYNKMVPTDKVEVVAMVAQAYQDGSINDNMARALLDKYGL